MVDSQVPVVRAYDHAGVYLGDLGRSGQGPGEYTSPSFLTADENGRVYVLDSRLGRVNVYGPGGEVLDPWPMTTSRCCVWPMYQLSTAALWMAVQQRVDTPGVDAIYGVQAVGPSGPYGEVTWILEIAFEQATYTTESGHEVEAPFSAWLVWSPAPAGKLVVGGADRYRFEVLGRDGSRLVVERYWKPAPVPPEHKEWERRRTIVFNRTYNNPEFTLDASIIPDHKAAYIWLNPTLSGEIWVSRQGPSKRLPDCSGDPFEAGQTAAWENPCWTDEPIYDAFGADGRHLGNVEMPPEVWAGVDTFVDGRMVVTGIQDPRGTIMVKRYRLVLPGE